MNYKRIVFKYIMISFSLIFLFLGSWQVKRLIWKKDIIQQIKQDSSQKKAFLSDSKNLNDKLYKKFKMIGRLHHDKEIHLYSGGKMSHGSDGYLIFTPLELQNGDMILVNRGWVPQTKKESIKRQETLIMGNIEIEGVVLPIKEPRWIFFKNNLKTNVWLWLNLEELSDYVEFKLEPYYIMQQNNWNKIPINAKFSEDLIRNDHLQYALTWYSFFIMNSYIIWIFRKKSVI